MTVRAARPGDADWMGRVHAEAWQETYAGLLPPPVIDGVNAAARASFWRDEIAAGLSAIAVVEGVGFASSGPQREEAFRQRGWAEELYALYLLRRAQGQGHGRSLFRAVRPAGPFTCCVVAGNEAACRFYEAMGGRVLLTRPERIGPAAITEHVYAWGTP